jgi:hypothetical protein
MSEIRSKSEILAEINLEWATLERLLNRLSEEQMLTPGVTGQWSVKDILAHIVAWEKVMLDRMEGILSEQPLKYPPIRNNEDVDHFNHNAFLENREASLSSVQLEFRTIYQGFLTVYDALDEDALTRPVPWDWASDDLRLWHIIVANTSDHYREHRLEIEEFFHLV